MSRILRSLVCLLLICCILVNLSPLKAKAVTPGMVAVGTVSALVLIPAILYGLGVMQSYTDTGSAAFNQLVSDCNDHLTNLGWIAAGAATMLSLTQDGTTITYAHRNMIQDVFDWLWSSGNIFNSSNSAFSGESYTLVSGTSFKIGTAYSPVTHFRAWAPLQSGGGYVYDCFISSGQFSYHYNGGSEKWANAVSPDDVSYRFVAFNTYYSSPPSGLVSIGVSNVDYTSNVEWQLIRCFVNGYFGLSSVNDLTLGQVADQDTEIETGYETYIQEGIVSIDFGIQFEEGSPYDPDGDDQKYHHWFPFKVPSPENLSNLTQEDAWSGESEVELEYKTDTDTGTDSGDGSGNGSGNTGTDSGSTGNTGSSWKPPSDHSQFALADLSKFFPFCIPFDLFDFFKLLNADPVAPSFTWEIQDLSGQTYGLTVDLSQWDSVAQLFRRLQLFLFVCGLAAASRKYIKW